MTVFIMAAGNSARCFEIPKQLLVLPDGRTILDRLVRQVGRYAYSPVVVTHRSSILDVSSRWLKPLDRRTLCDSILSTEEMWTETNIFILGDVVFTLAGLSRTMEMSGEMSVVGNEAEIYAMQFSLANKSKIVKSLKEAASYRFGKLRYFYKVYTGLPIEGPYYEKNYMTWLRDATNDIDSISTYEAMLKNWNANMNQPGTGEAHSG